MKRHIRISEPLNRREFLLIDLDALTPIDLEHIPQRHINMPGGQPYRRRARDHQGLGNLISGNNPKFLKEFAYHRFSRVLTRLNMATRRQPELRTFMIDEKNVVSINDGEIGD